VSDAREAGKERTVGVDIEACCHSCHGTILSSLNPSGLKSSSNIGTLESKKNRPPCCEHVLYVQQGSKSHTRFIC
jgi:hypothetical protein